MYLSVIFPPLSPFFSGQLSSVGVSFSPPLHFGDSFTLGITELIVPMEYLGSLPVRFFLEYLFHFACLYSQTRICSAYRGVSLKKSHLFGLAAFPTTALKAAYELPKTNQYRKTHSFSCGSITN